MLWHFYKRSIDLLMLTYLSGSIIAVVMFWTSELLPNNWEASGFLLLALLLIAMSSISVVWLRGIARVNDADIDTDIDSKPIAAELSEPSRGDYES